MPSKWKKINSGELPDGSTLSLRTRTMEFNPIEQYYIREIRAEQLKDKELIGRDQYQLRLNIYLKKEVDLMLRSAGFSEVKIFSGLSDREPIPYKDYYLMVMAS